MIYGPSINVNTNGFKQCEVWRMLQCVEEEREEEPPSGTHLWWCVEDNVAVDDKDRGSSTFTFTNLDTFLLQIRWQCILLSLSLSLSSNKHQDRCLESLRGDWLVKLYLSSWSGCDFCLGCVFWLFWLLLCNSNWDCIGLDWMWRKSSLVRTVMIRIKLKFFFFFFG